MYLVKRDLAGRAFLLQFFQIMEEFGDEIPWLEPLKTIQFSTNGVYFRDQFIKLLRLREEQDITAFQFITMERGREFIGGFVHFSRSPESFQDRKNSEICEVLNYQGYSFVSCLQIRDCYHGEGLGDLLMKKALPAIIGTHGRVWGVVSRPGLVRWYKSLGATVLSDPQNRDNLWIISWE